MHTFKLKQAVHNKSSLNINFTHLYASVKDRDLNKFEKS